MKDELYAIKRAVYCRFRHTYYLTFTAVDDLMRPYCRIERHWCNACRSTWTLGWSTKL